jgi:hypothetical protein
MAELLEGKRNGSGETGRGVTCAVSFRDTIILKDYTSQRAFVKALFRDAIFYSGQPIVAEVKSSCHKNTRVQTNTQTPWP